jgi:hypothetical protein
MPVETALQGLLLAAALLSQNVCDSMLLEVAYGML